MDFKDYLTEASARRSVSLDAVADIMAEANEMNKINEGLGMTIMVKSAVGLFKLGFGIKDVAATIGSALSKAEIKKMMPDFKEAFGKQADKGGKDAKKLRMVPSAIMFSKF